MRKNMPGKLNGTQWIPLLKNRKIQNYTSRFQKPSRLLLSNIHYRLRIRLEIWGCAVFCNNYWCVCLKTKLMPHYDLIWVRLKPSLSPCSLQHFLSSVLNEWGMNEDHSVWNWLPLACQSICLTPQARAVIGGPCTHTPFLPTKQPICPPSRGQPWYGAHAFTEPVIGIWS